MNWWLACLYWFRNTRQTKGYNKGTTIRRCVCFDLKKRLILFNTRYCTRLETSCLERIKRNDKYPRWRPGNFCTFALFLTMIYKATSSGMLMENCWSLVYWCWYSTWKKVLEEEDEEKAKQRKTISKFYICCLLTWINHILNICLYQKFILLLIRFSTTFCQR